MIENILQNMDRVTTEWREKAERNSKMYSLERRYYKSWGELGRSEGNEVTVDQIAKVIDSELVLLEFYIEQFPFDFSDKEKNNFYTKSRERELRKVREARKLDNPLGRIEAILFFHERQEYPLDQKIIKGTHEFGLRAESCTKAIEFLSKTI
ncbi:MAG: hypothetical protein Q8P80_02565 [Candidatus Levybacteria bacterium]|nr:hypothetical protein [Candidatus Levybacteria bacterium]